MTTVDQTIAQMLVSEFAGLTNKELADAIHERYEGCYTSNEESNPFSPMVLTFEDHSTLSIVGWDIDNEGTDELGATDETPVLTAGIEQSENFEIGEETSMGVNKYRYELDDLYSTNKQGFVQYSISGKIISIDAVEYVGPLPKDQVKVMLEDCTANQAANQLETMDSLTIVWKPSALSFFTNDPILVNEVNDTNRLDGFVAKTIDIFQYNQLGYGYVSFITATNATIVVVAVEYQHEEGYWPSQAELNGLIIEEANKLGPVVYKSIIWSIDAYASQTRKHN